MWTNLKSVELDIGIAVGKPLYQTLDNLLGTVAVRRDLVAHLEDGTPVLRGQILVRGLGYIIVSIGIHQTILAS